MPRKGLLEADDMFQGSPDDDWKEFTVDAGDEPKEPKFADWSKLIAEGVNPKLPSVAEIIEGQFLLYLNEISSWHAEPGTGKSNLTVVLAMIVAAMGELVLIIDGEDHYENFFIRWNGLSGDLSIIHRVHHHHRPTTTEWKDLHAWVKKVKFALIIVDGLAQLMVSDGKDETKIGDVLAFYEKMIEPLRGPDTAVAVSDHVIKGAKGNNRWPRGSGGKLGFYGGVVLDLQLGEAYSPSKEGFIKCVGAKDRWGEVAPEGIHAFNLHFEPTGEVFRMPNGKEIKVSRWFWRRPGGAAREKVEWTPSGIMEDVSRRLEAIPNTSLTQLRKLARSSAHVDIAIERLVATGHLEIAGGGKGSGRRNEYRLLERYRCPERAARQHGDSDDSDDNESPAA